MVSAEEGTDFETVLVYPKLVITFCYVTWIDELIHYILLLFILDPSYEYYERGDCSC